MVVLIFVLFVLYTIACCLDGPDLKPKWKRWLGAKLEQKANELKPIKYCRPYDCDKFEKAMAHPLRELAPVQVSTVKLHQIEHSMRIGEDVLYELHMRQEMLERSGIPSWQIPRCDTIDEVIDKAKVSCMNAVLNQAQQFIDCHVVNDEYRMEYVVNCRLDVGIHNDKRNDGRYC